MVYLKHWNDFKAQALALYAKSPDRVRTPNGLTARHASCSRHGQAHRSWCSSSPTIIRYAAAQATDPDAQVPRQVVHHPEPLRGIPAKTARGHVGRPSRAHLAHPSRSRSPYPDARRIKQRTSRTRYHTKGAFQKQEQEKGQEKVIYKTSAPFKIPWSSFSSWSSSSLSLPPWDECKARTKRRGPSRILGYVRCPVKSQRSWAKKLASSALVALYIRCKSTSYRS